MKYLLLFMTVLQIKTFWNSFKNIFKSHTVLKNEVDDALQRAETIARNRNVMISCMTLCMIVHGLFLTLYYILAGVYVKNFIFVALSCIYVVNSWRNMLKAYEYLKKRDATILRYSLFNRVCTLIHLSYIGYFVYYLMTTW